MPPHAVLSRLSDADWDRMIKVHLYGTFHGCRAALRHMEPARRGVIVNVASVLGLWPSSGAPDYSTAKAAIIALTKSVAGEVAHLPELRQAILMQIATERMAQPEELAEVVRFLVGDEASYCTGEIWSASGAYG
jgi:3-oxoacyl-[acyl-carrier protein] reductase